MKLISKTLFYYLLISLPLLVLASALSYFLIQSELKDGTDESLINEEKYSESLAHNLKDSIFYISPDSLSNIKLVSSVHSCSGFKDTVIFNELENEILSARMLRTYYSIGNRTFQITLVKTTVEEEELFEGILAAFILIILFLIISFIIVNWLLSKILWKPFYKTLSLLGKYEIKDFKQHYFASENTTEFDQLNKVLNEMTEKIYLDYLKQKEFIENASHEMQTPLAVLKANLSLLIQSPNLKKEEMDRLEIIENTIKKLSSLNKALLLLSKIENNQFNQTETVNIKTIITKIVGNFQDVIQSKNINIELVLKEEALIKMNPILADILITNLIQNAYRHNNNDGKILISLNNNELNILNTGKPLSIPENQLFERFKKNESTHESLGLGLSIVNSISKLYGYTIIYKYENSMHNFKISFN